MKNFIVVLVCVLLTGSCNKGEEDYSDMPIYFAGDTSNGSLKISKNSRSMEAGVILYPCHNDPNLLAFNISTVDSFGILSEVLGVECVIVEINKFQFCKNHDPNCQISIYYYTTYDDQAEDHYILNTQRNNFIEITDIDTIQGWISGRMEMHFDRDKSKPKALATNPEKVSFTEGTFTAKLPE